ncbi:Pimelyl-[acyl-carrier protein] methyl ester esterase [Piscirickettsia salmonis]|uniref:alpha/beta fold hydrolase n=1 Tax=Piscirickettsia salmonis TaxID=1238 RepID=UPI0012B744E3|nr:alpha/beta fold hydrolase [Piscirickettsia salmonis]QGP49159.1 Pimelyl-[acyl-carrier protein] methyl ester esterase [Piscirickettsia salmonis]
MAKKNLVLIHGWGASSWVWQGVCQYLSDEFTICTIDLPGYAQIADQGARNIQQIAEYVLTMMIQQGLKESVVVGWSLGGLIARQVTIMARKQQVRGLITIASPPYFVKENGWNGLNSQQLLAFQQVFSDTETDVGIANILRLKQRFCALQIQGGYKPANFVAWAKRFVAEKVASTALNLGLEILATVDFRALECDFIQPQLHLYGEYDRIAPLTLPYYQTTGLDYQVIIGSAHLPLLTHVHELAAWIRILSNDKTTV